MKLEFVGHLVGGGSNPSSDSQALERARFGSGTPVESAGDPVNHPPHYGGADDPYEAIKVIEAWRLGFNLGNAVKYVRRCDHKGAPLDDLRKARFYLDREIQNREIQNGDVLAVLQSALERAGTK